MEGEGGIMRTDTDPIMEEDLSFALVMAKPCYYETPLELFVMACFADLVAAETLLLDFA